MSSLSSDLSLRADSYVRSYCMSHAVLVLEVIAEGITLKNLERKHRVCEPVRGSAELLASLLHLHPRLRVTI